APGSTTPSIAAERPTEIGRRQIDSVAARAVHPLQLARPERGNKSAVRVGMWAGAPARPAQAQVPVAGPGRGAASVGGAVTRHSGAGRIALGAETCRAAVAVEARAATRFLRPAATTGRVRGRLPAAARRASVAVAEAALAAAAVVAADDADEP